MQRRKFIKNTLITSVSLMGGVSAWQLFEQWDAGRALEFKPLNFLGPDDQMVLSVLIPVFCQGMANLPEQHRVLTNIDQAIIRLPQRSREELRQLFDLLTSMLGRLLLAQTWQPWPKASARAIESFLNQWRESSLQLLQIAYKGLHQLVMGAVYAEAESWPGLGYSGPPVISAAYAISAIKLVPEQGDN